MTDPVRFTVRVDDAWAVSVVGPGGQVAPAPPPLWSAAGVPSEPPNTPAPEKFLHQLWDAKTMAADDIPGLYEKVFTDEVYEPADVVAFGRFLFDRLLGQHTWDAIRTAAGTADFVELALRFDAQRYDLHRFPWELMHDESGFLAQGKPPACVTRLIERDETASGAPEPAQPQPFQQPARLLFVVGTTLKDRRILPGAEVFGLLRQLRSRDRIVNTRVVHSTSPQKLNRIVEDYEPDLVHFICHGVLRQDKEHPLSGALEFKSDDKKRNVEYRYADEILDDLQVGDRIPPLVVLSACYTGIAPMADPKDPEKTVKVEEHRAAGVDRIGSLAAELVAGGIPVVVGMGGHVSDSACRLFTRFFGEAVLSGESLVGAVARGRRAAFQWGPSKTADWAFPTLFVAADLKVPYHPVEDPSGIDPCKALAQRIHQDYGVPKYPVFCGRHEFFERYQLLFRSGEKPILFIYAEVSTAGLGRTRLLQELAAQALRDGHIPCLVSSSNPDWPHQPFDNVAQLAVEILTRIDEAREAFGLPPPFDSHVLKAILKTQQHGLQERWEFYSLIEQATAAEGPGPSAKVLRGALHKDFQALIEEARHADLPQIGPESRVVLLLDNVHKYGEAIQPLLDTLVTGYGLGIDTEPVPVILCYNKESTTESLFTAASETIGNLEMELKPFSNEGDEDLLAYEQVLLFPDKENKHAQTWTEFLRVELKEKVEGPVASYAFNHRAKANVKNKWIPKFRLAIRGIPQRMKGEEGMFERAVDAYWDGFLVLGDDEARLAKLLGGEDGDSGSHSSGS